MARLSCNRNGSPSSLWIIIRIFINLGLYFRHRDKAAIQFESFLFLCVYKNILMNIAYGLTIFA